MIFIDCTHFMLKKPGPEIVPLAAWFLQFFNLYCECWSSATHTRRETCSVCSDTSKVKMAVMVVYFLNIIIGNKWKQDKSKYI